MLEKNYLTVALIILYIKEKEMCPVYISKINLDCEKEIILLMIPNDEEVVWNYHTVKKLSALLRNNFKRRWWLLLFKLPSFF